MSLQMGKSRLSRFMLAAGSGLLLTAAFPKFEQAWLAWLALIPLVLALRRADTKSAFLLGLACGGAHFLTLVYWVIHSMHTYGGLPWAAAAVVLVLLAIYLAVFPALFCACLVRLARSPLQALWLAPVTWVAMEYLRAKVFSGFPWELAGYSQYRFLHLIQVADLVGVYGISALLLFANTAMAIALLHWSELPWQGAIPTARQAITGLATLVLLTAALLVYGDLRMAATDRAMEKSPAVSVAIVQGNVDQAVKWDPRFQVLTTVKYRDLSRVAARSHPELIVWPETATPFFFGEDRALTRLVARTITETKSAYLIGSPARKKENGRQVLFNRAYLLDKDAHVTGTYDKVHLVPFGEYVPFKRWLPFIDTLVAQVGNFRPGTKGSILNWDKGPIGVQICYEVIFPGLARAAVSKGARILVNLTNDAWFGTTSAAFQHFSMAVFRAIETRRSLVRAANTGISGFIDPAGRIQATTGLFSAKVLCRPVKLLNIKTLYTGWGDWFAIICLTITVAGAIMPAIVGFQKRWRPARNGKGHLN